MKTCSKCKVEKSKEDFYLRSDTGKRRTDCKECKAARDKVYGAENREAILAKHRAYYAENKEEMNAQSKIYSAEHREEIAAQRKINYAKNRKEILEKVRTHRAENLEEVRARDRVYCAKNRQKKESQRKVREYGVAPDDLKRMLAHQGGVCAICGGLAGKKGFGVDHDHDSKKVRGLLCQTCNLAIGLLKDSSAVAQLAVNYLKKHGK